MPTYRKLPVKVEAFRLGFDDPEEWYLDAVMNGKVHFDGGVTNIKTTEGTMIARSGDWIIEGVHGELYPCKHEIFVKTYEPA